MFVWRGGDFVPKRKEFSFFRWNFQLAAPPGHLKGFFKNTSECFVQIFYNYAWTETIKGKMKIHGMYHAIYKFVLQY